MTRDFLWLVLLKDALPRAEDLFSALPKEKKDKALRYVRLEDRVRSAVGSLLIQKAVGGKPVLLAPKGKPYVDGGPHFSLSHAGDYIGLYVSAHNCGFDVEEISRCDVSIVPAAFTKEEAKEISDSSTMAACWTLKEALAKCQGEGILSPKTVGFTRHGDKVEYMGRVYVAKTFVQEGHAFSLVNESCAAFPEPAFQTIDALLK